MIRSIATASAVVASCCLFHFSFAQAAEIEKPLIWQVSKNGTSGVAITTGVRLKTVYEPKIGVDTSIIATRAGTVDSSTLPMRLWGKIRLDDGRPVAVGATYLTADFDPNAGATSLFLQQTHNWIVTPSLDLGSSRVLKAHRISGEGAGLLASQRFDLSLSDFRTSVFTEASLDSLDWISTGSIGIEKKIFSGASLSASIINLTDTPQPAFNASFRRNW